MSMRWCAPKTPRASQMAGASRVVNMYTYDVVSESFRNPQELAAELTRRSHEGWEVVEIVNDGTHWFHAFIRHAGNVAVAPRPGMPGGITTGDTPTMAATSSTVAPASQTTTPSGAGTTPSSATGAAPSVPANWYKDPSGRFELRYWNGSAWTEHVSTGGTQSIDPPKA